MSTDSKSSPVIEQSFVIPGRLPYMNDILQAKGNSYGGGRSKYTGMKDRYTKSCMMDIYAANLIPVGVCRIQYTWRVKNAQADGDGVDAGRKFINDALQACGVIVNDNIKWVKEQNHKYVVDKENEGVTVSIVGQRRAIQKGMFDGS